MEYNKLVYEIAYNVLSESVSESMLGKLLQGACGKNKDLKNFIKYVDDKNDKVGEYRRRTKQIEATSDPKERARLEKKQADMRTKHGITDDDRTIGGHTANAARKVGKVTGNIIQKGKEALKKGKEALNKSNNSPIGLSSLRKN